MLVAAVLQIMVMMSPYMTGQRHFVNPHSNAERRVRNPGLRGNVIPCKGFEMICLNSGLPITNCKNLGKFLASLAPELTVECCENSVRSWMWAFRTVPSP